jgi:hypothetical protein
MLARAAGRGPPGRLALGQIKKIYMSDREGRNQKTGGDLTEAHRLQTEQKLNRAHGFEHLQGWDVDRTVLERMRAQGGTRRTVKENTTALRGILRWATRRTSSARHRSKPYPSGAPSEAGPQGHCRAVASARGAGPAFRAQRRQSRFSGVGGTV